MKFISYISVIVLSVGFLSCRSPNKDYKLTEKQKVRVHQGYEYQRSKADKDNDEKKLARIERDKKRILHNRKVASSRNPRKKAAGKQVAKPFSF